MQTQETALEAIKVQFPEVQFWMFSGRTATGKRIKGQMFPRNVAVPVWEKKTQILMRRLPYMKRVDETEILKGKVRKAMSEKKEIVIPPNWKEAHHKRRIAWARAISNEDIHSVAHADTILNARVPQPAPEARKPEPVNG